MFIDTRDLPEGSRIDCDLAIIGGGPAGITVARELAGSGLRICLLEAGDEHYDAESQALYQGENVGVKYNVEGTRLRFFGGASNHWGGFCRPLDPIDFEARDWVPHSGWPFGADHLREDYRRAADLVEIGPADFRDPVHWRDTLGQETVPQPSGRMETQYIHYSPPTHFGERYGPELRASETVRVLFHANVVNIAARPDAASVSHLELRTLTGRSHRVMARRFVLACGGLENARMLLLSRDVQRAGLGNGNDLVGRYFMEHPHLDGTCEIVMADAERLPRCYRMHIDAGGHRASAAFKPSESNLREGRLLNATFMVGVAGSYRSDAAAAVGDRAHGARHRTMLRAGRRLLAEGRRSALPSDPAHEGHWLTVGCAGEQVPNPDSRVMLGSRLDALGLPCIRLDWRLTDQDRLSLFAQLQNFAMELGALDVARVLLNYQAEESWVERVAGGCHHMGTTRMHSDPRRGVVDADCRVHGIENLWVAGSSVFPTSGTANPTLTLVALAVRLARHLRSLPA